MIPMPETGRPVPWALLVALSVCAPAGLSAQELKPATAHAFDCYAQSAEARLDARNVWVHVGRVNSLRRLVDAASIGCDSIDGTQSVRFRDTYLRQGLQACAAGAQ